MRVCGCVNFISFLCHQAPSVILSETYFRYNLFDFQLFFIVMKPKKQEKEEKILKLYCHYHNLIIDKKQKL